MGKDRTTDPARQWTGEPYDSIDSALRLFVAQSRTEAETAVAMVADPYVAPSAHGTWTENHRTVDRFRTASTDTDRGDVEAVRFARDRTRNGNIDEFISVCKSSREPHAPFLTYPGNHDDPTTALDGHLRRYDSHSAITRSSTASTE